MEDFQKEDFLRILKNWNEGTATPEEVTFLYSYYRAFETHPDILNSLTRHEQDQLEADLRTRIEKKISERERSASRTLKRRLVAGIAAAAAVAAIVFVIIAPPARQEKLLVERNGQTMPNAKQNNFIDLPDGSTVVLSAGSHIEYSSSFSADAKREIYLTGEAYFDVKHLPEKPFVVYAGKLTTTVLGTAFTIKDMPKDGNITVTVSRGRVKLEDARQSFGILEPNQQLVYYKEQKTASQAVVDADKQEGWKQEGLLLDNVTVASAAHLLEELYNVQIVVVDEELKEERFTTTIDKDESLESVIRSIAQFNNAVFRVDRETNTISISTE